MSDSNEPDTGLFDENPAPGDHHIANYVEYVGDRCRRHRLSLPYEKRSRKHFGNEVLSKYYGSSVSRGRIERAEAGDHGVHWGVIAAYFNEIGVFPEIIQALERGRSPTLSVLMLMKERLKPEQEKSKELARAKLLQRAAEERQKGFTD